MMNNLIEQSKDKIKINCLNNGLSKQYPLGTQLIDIALDMKVHTRCPILGARVNNSLKELNFRLFDPVFIEFIDITDADGFRMYQRSLSFVLMKAAKDIFPDAKLKIQSSISKGLYCEIDKETQITVEEIFKIGERMKEIIDANLPFYREKIPTSEAIKIFEKNGLIEKVELFQTRPTLFTSVYKLDDMVDYFYGFLVPSTGFLEVFDLIPYYKGMLLRYPQSSKPDDLGEVIEQKKMFEIFKEYKQWGKILGISTVGNINNIIKKGKAGELIKISEALHEKKVSQIADMIVKKGTVKIILISGPSSSGKTTFSKRLEVQLKVNGVFSLPIAMDNFFVEREQTPKDEKGDYDFEALEAVDIKLFTETMLSLMEGKPTVIAEFDFKHGKKVFNKEPVILPAEGLLIIEGIHALNPKVYERFGADVVFKIYVSALTQIGIDAHNRIPTTDNRLLRRIIRDYQYRGYSCQNTLQRWASVRRGEDKNIFPFQENADIMFNTALLYELPLLKRYVEPLLKKVPETVREYSETKRLIKFLSYFEELDAAAEKEIPPTSIIREFLYGSSFKY